MLRSYLSNQLARPDCVRIAVHLADCPRCMATMTEIEERVQFIKRLFDSPVTGPEYSEIELASALERLILRLDSHGDMHSHVSGGLWHRLPKWALTAIVASVLVAALFSLPAVRNSARQVFDTFRRWFLIADDKPSRENQRPLVAANPQKLPEPSERTVTGQVPGLPSLAGGQFGSLETLPDRAQPPDYLTKNNEKLVAYKSGFEPGTEYVITGDVRSEPGEPIPGAIVSLHRSGFNYRDFKMPAPVSTQICDEAGRYSISIDSPSEVHLTVSAEGFAQFLEDFPPLAQGTTTRNYRLRRTACVEGFVRDKDRKPIENATVRASTSELNWGSDFYSAIPLRTVTGPAGEYSIRRIAAGGGTITALSSRYLSRHQSGFLAHGDCTRVDFQLSPAKSFSITVKNRAGEALTDARLWTHAGPYVYSDSAGRMEFAADPDSDPFDCWIISKGFRAAHLLLSSKSPTSEIVMEEGRVFSGRVLSESGEPVANALVQLMAGIDPVRKEVTQTDDLGTFSIVSDYPVITVSVYGPGYRGESYKFSEAIPAPQELEIRLKEQKGGGVFGRALDSSGRPSERFSVNLYEPSTTPRRGFSRLFQNEAGVFFLDDVPAGIYDLEVWSQPYSQIERGSYLKLGRVEIREGSVFGEIRIQFPPPKTVR